MSGSNRQEYSYKIPQLKQNNYISKKNVNVRKHMRFILICEAFLGIHRLYLYDFSKCTIRLSKTYSVMLTITTAFFLFTSNLFNFHHVMYRDSNCVEYLMLSFSAFFLQKKRLNKFFEEIQRIDQILNIEEYVSITTPAKWYLLGIGVSIVYNILDNFLCLAFIRLYSDSDFIRNSLHALYIPITVHDSENIFFCILLVIISRRLEIVKAHVSKVFATKGKWMKSQDKFEALSDKANLDVNGLHKVYDSLHICSEVLNSVMSFPILVIITTSAISTIMLIKNFIIFFQQSSIIPSAYNTTKFYQTATAFVFARCLKYTVFVIFPCYISNITKSRAASIRSSLYAALTNKQLDFIERRKLKAFFLLTCERNFTYVLCTVLKMDMSLPIGYCSVCITYLIIAIQFSRFIY